LNGYRAWLKSTGMNTGADIVRRVALENSINPRLLLAILEYQGGWVYGSPDNSTLDEYPLGYVDAKYKGLYRQLVWAVNHLSVGYYGYREGRLTEIRFSDGVTARLAPDLNAGSVALQYFFAQIYPSDRWLEAMDPAAGLPAVYANLFGDPWVRAETVEPLYPIDLTQAPMLLPFEPNHVWAFTGGPHGAWEHDGSYAALDFAPPSVTQGCQDTRVWVTAAASGMVVRSEAGVVVLDLDGDGSELTGWVLVYLHVSHQGRITVGNFVVAGQPLGHPSCEGGFATGTHVHLARKYNGEWIAADGPIPFNLSGWIAHAGPAAYKGTLTRGDRTVTACTCSNNQTFISLDGDDQ
jgi:murein DD-endopeptidase MepM/ murein hydrolase activator NlpD